MTEYIINRDKKDLITFMNKRAERMGLWCRFENDKVTVESKQGEDMKSQTPIPVMFKGKISEEAGQIKITGKFTYGFYLTTLVIVAAILIIARLSWSVYQKQLDNIILCGIVTVLLIFVCVVVRIRGTELKAKINEFLENLNKK